jgi:hypothetical protein
VTRGTAMEQRTAWQCGAQGAAKSLKERERDDRESEIVRLKSQESEQSRPPVPIERRCDDPSLPSRKNFFNDSHPNGPNIVPLTA